MTQFLLPCGTFLAYCYFPTLLLFGETILTVVRGHKIEPACLVEKHANTALFWQSWLGGLGVLLLLGLSGNLHRILAVGKLGDACDWPVLLKAGLCIAVLRMVFGREMRQAHPKAPEQSPLARRIAGLSLASYLLYSLNMVLLTPILEEFVFRYLFLHQAIPSQTDSVLLLLASAFLFAVIHRKAYLTYFLAGLMLGVNFLLTQSYWECVIIHVMNNVWVEAERRRARRFFLLQFPG